MCRRLSSATARVSPSRQTVGFDAVCRGTLAATSVTVVQRTVEEQSSGSKDVAPVTECPLLLERETPTPPPCSGKWRFPRPVYLFCTKTRCAPLRVFSSPPLPTAHVSTTGVVVCGLWADCVVPLLLPLHLLPELVLKPNEPCQSHLVFFSRVKPT